MQTDVQQRAERPPREVHRTEIDGIPVLWADVPGPVTGGVAFRVGWADEALADGGITHVVEHLAFHPLGRTRYESNGNVEALQTNFWASGTTAEVATFLEQVGVALSALPLDRLDLELRVLRTEEESASGGALADLKRDRFGAVGHGTWSYLDFGLRRLRRDDVEAWARRYFTKGNAMIWLTTEPPAELRLPLPDGPRQAVPEQRVNALEFPTLVLEGSGTVAFTMYGERSVAARAALQTFERRLEAELRYGRGITYAVTGWYEPTSKDRAHFGITLDCLDESAEEVLTTALSILDGLAETGLTADELRENVEDYRRILDDPESVIGYVHYAIESELLGAQVETEAELLELEEALTAEETAAAVRGFRETLMAYAPTTVTPDEKRFTPYPIWSPDTVTGTTYKPKKLPFRRAEHTPVVVGDAGAMCVFDDGVLTVPYAECVAALVYDDGVSLIRENATQITIDPRAYRRGDELQQRLLDGVPPERVVRYTSA